MIEQTMIDNEEKIVEILIDRGKKLLESEPETIKFTGNEKVDELLNDLDKYPHAYVLACIMDKQIKAERAWLIPHLISQEIGGFEFRKLLKLDLNKITKTFKKRSLHRFNNVMGKSFYLAIQKIHNDYGGDASKIWKDNPRSAIIVKRFLEFKGVGIKIATMATNILAWGFKIPMKDHICIDISPDIHVKRVFKRLGLLSKEGSNEELVYSARGLYPKYPGIFDFSCWEIGREWCRPENPKCSECYLNKYCPKKL